MTSFSSRRNAAIAEFSPFTRCQDVNAMKLFTGPNHPLYFQDKGANVLENSSLAVQFQNVENWIFDLDNTLYPRHTDLFAQIDQKISAYVSRLLDLTHEEARKVQKGYYRDYGTTLRGLMMEHKISPDAFLEYVHDIDYSPVEPNPELGAAIEKLPGRKFIFTNGDRPHAERTANALGITDHFEDIFDIVWGDLIPKPHMSVYEKLIAETGINPKQTAMFEDLAKNLKAPDALGMQTVLIVPDRMRDVFHEDWEAEGRDAPHVHHITDDLVGFLQSLPGAE